MAKPWPAVVGQLQEPGPEMRGPSPKSVSPMQWSRDRLRASQGAGVAAIPVGQANEVPALRAVPSAVAPAAPPAAAAVPAERLGPVRRMANALRGAATGARGAVTGPLAAATLRAGVPGVLGAVAGGVQRSVDAQAPELPMPAPQHFASGNIPTDPSLRGPPAIADQSPLGVGPNNAFTRGVANTLNALPGGSGLRAAVQALRGGSNAARVASVGGRVEDAATLFARGAQGSNEAAQVSAPTGAAVTAGPTPTEGLPAWRDQPTPQTIRPAPPTGNAAGTFRYADGSTGKGTVSSLDTIGVEGYQRQLANIRALDDGSTPALAGGIGGGRIGDTLRAKTDAGRVPAGLSARQAAGFQQQEADRVQRGELATAQLGVAAAGQNQGLRIAEMNNATQRDNNAATTRVALRGHELDYERGMAPIRFQQQQREQIAGLLRASGGDPAAAAQRALAAGRVDLAETLAKPVATLQEQAGKADALTETKRKEAATGMKGAFNHMDKEGLPKMSEALEAKAYARLLRANPDFHKEGDPAKRQKMIDDALGDEELMARFEQPQGGGFASVVPNFISGNKPMLRQNNIPGDELLGRGQIGGVVGGLRGALSPNAEKGDRFFDPGDGYEAVNMGDLSARALARLEQHRAAAAGRLRQGK